jgi:hypothetical protein
MFLIFIQHVIGALEHRNEIVIFNYADDLAMVTKSLCARINSIRLQLALRRLIKAADEVQIQFDADKSEYIHFHKGRDPINIRITLTFTTYESSKTVKVRLQEQFKWLGIWLDRKLTPFDGLTPLRGEWDEYFLLRALLNRRETKMSPQTYR